MQYSYRGIYPEDLSEQLMHHYRVLLKQLYREHQGPDIEKAIGAHWQCASKISIISPHLGPVELREGKHRILLVSHCKTPNTHR